MNKNRSQIEKLIKAETTIYHALNLLKASLNYTCPDTTTYRAAQGALVDYLLTIQREMEELGYAEEEEL